MLEQLDDLAVAAASLLARGALQGAGDEAARTVAHRIREFIRNKFGKDEKLLAAVGKIEESPGDARALEAVAYELTWLARANPVVRQQLAALVEEGEQNPALAAIIARDSAKINKAVYISKVQGDVSF
jgi:aryl-alcohol dehydrogenase-like predicted oxidoreductase